MRSVFYCLLCAILLVAMSKGVAFKITTPAGEERIIEFGIGVIVDEEEEESCHDST